MNKAITLDSNVFRTQEFLDWLMSDSPPPNRHIFPLILYIEVLVWYEMRGLQRGDLDKDLEKMRTEIVPFEMDYVDALMTNIRSNPSFQFRHHARDFLIGTICQRHHSLLITYNKRHFAWLDSKMIFTPEEYLKKALKME
ncbi:MAG: type II toxin-antitoxin system VapC family toxin [Candidatus Thorarchaeota archaeon]